MLPGFVAVALSRLERETAISCFPISVLVRSYLVLVCAVVRLVLPALVARLIFFRVLRSIAAVLCFANVR